MTAGPLSSVITAAERVSTGDRDGALVLVAGFDAAGHVRLRHAAVRVLAGVLSPQHFGELRSGVHRLAERVGAADSLVVLNLEVVAAAEAVHTGANDRADAIFNGSEFLPLDHAHVAVSLLGQAVDSWMGDRAAVFFDALRREYGVTG